MQWAEHIEDKLGEPFRMMSDFFFLNTSSKVLHLLSALKQSGKYVELCFICVSGDNRDAFFMIPNNSAAMIFYNKSSGRCSSCKSFIREEEPIHEGVHVGDAIRCKLNNIFNDH